MTKAPKRKPFPILKSKSKQGKDFVFKTPGPYYFPGMLYYVNKSGSIKHTFKLKVPKSEIMTKPEFKKRFYDPEKALKNYLKKYD